MFTTLAEITRVRKQNAADMNTRMTSRPITQYK